MARSQSPPVEKKVSDEPDVVAEPSVPRGRSAWFGGPDVQVGPRIGPVITRTSDASDTDDSSNAILEKQRAEEEGCAIQYRTCSWQKVRLPSAPLLPPARVLPASRQLTQPAPRRPLSSSRNTFVW